MEDSREGPKRYQDIPRISFQLMFSPLNSASETDLLVQQVINRVRLQTKQNASFVQCLSNEFRLDTQTSSHNVPRAWNHVILVCRYAVVAAQFMQLIPEPEPII